MGFPAGFARLHPILRVLLERCPPDSWPPLSLEEPTPSLSWEGEVEVLLFFCERLRALADERRRRLQVTALQDVPDERWRHAREALLAQRPAQRPTVNELRVVLQALPPLESAMLNEHTQEMRSLLADLVAIIPRIECLERLREIATTPTATIDRVLLRAARGARSRPRKATPLREGPALWITRLVDGRFGALLEVGGRWQWIEGTHDDVLATIPAAHFAAAVVAVGKK
jgi:hypothetical protein